MGAISARAARWCSQKRDHLAFLYQRAPGGWRERREGGAEVSDEGMGA